MSEEQKEGQGSWAVMNKKDSEVDGGQVTESFLNHWGKLDSYCNKSHSKYLSRGVTWSDLGIEKVTLAVVGRAGYCRVREETETNWEAIT